MYFPDGVTSNKIAYFANLAFTIWLLQRIWAGSVSLKRSLSPDHSFHKESCRYLNFCTKEKRQEAGFWWEGIGVYLRESTGKRHWELRIPFCTNRNLRMVFDCSCKYMRRTCCRKAQMPFWPFVFSFRVKGKPFSFPTYFQRKKTQKLRLLMTSGKRSWRKSSRARRVTPDEAESLIGLDFDARSQLPFFRLRGILISRTCTFLVMTAGLSLSIAC